MLWNCNKCGLKGLPEALASCPGCGKARPKNAQMIGGIVPVPEPEPEVVSEPDKEPPPDPDAGKVTVQEGEGEDAQDH